MRLLVAIANHGTKNAAYLNRLLNEYRSMSFEVHFVVLSNVPKDLGTDVEVIVGCPTNDPWSLPFGHKRIFVERLADYDLFAYSEDDTLITERNIRAFLDVSNVLPKYEVPGFLRYEVDPAGNRFYSTIHSHFHWIPSSAKSVGPYTFARFTNDHSACYLLTREQLEMAVASGGFLVAPHNEKYDLLVTAATDPYTQCGLTKVICISQFEDFCLHHLPNQYLGRMGISEADLRPQLDALMSLASNGGTSNALLNSDTTLWQGAWSKNYYAPAMDDVVDLVPRAASRVLSIGCGWGATEAILVNRGVHVTGIPCDAVIGACAAARGIEIVAPDLSEATEMLSCRSFDCILLLDVLQHVPDPCRMASHAARLLAPGGVLLIRAPNFNHVGVWRALSRGHITWRQRRDFAESNVHFTTKRMITHWLKLAGLEVVRIRWQHENRYRNAARWSAGLCNALLASHMMIVARRTGR